MARSPETWVRAPGETDADLLHRCIDGDEGAWAQLVTRYRDLVYSTALDTGLEPEDARDVFQEVWLELHRSATRIHNPMALPRWLMVATRRLSYKFATRRRRMVPGISSDLIDPSSLPDAQVADMESRNRLESALVELGGKCEVLLRYLFLRARPLPYEELSKRTGLAIGSIGPIRSRCLNRLRNLLGESNEREL